MVGGPVGANSPPPPGRRPRRVEQRADQPGHGVGEGPQGGFARGVGALDRANGRGNIDGVHHGIAPSRVRDAVRAGQPRRNARCARHAPPARRPSGPRQPGLCRSVLGGATAKLPHAEDPVRWRGGPGGRVPSQRGPAWAALGPPGENSRTTGGGPGRRGVRRSRAAVRVIVRIGRPGRVARFVVHGAPPLACQAVHARPPRVPPTSCEVAARTGSVVSGHLGRVSRQARSLATRRAWRSAACLARCAWKLITET